MHASRVRSDELRFCRHMANKAVRALDVHARTGAPAPFDIPAVCDAETLNIRELALDPAVCTIGATGAPAAPGAEKGTPKAGLRLGAAAGAACRWHDRGMIASEVPHIPNEDTCRSIECFSRLQFCEQADLA